MERGSTKREILEAALELFSLQGYEATPVSQIADAVGIRKASLYSHFSGKQEILDTLLEAVTEEYEARSMFSKKKDAEYVEEPTPEIWKLPDEEAVQLVLKHIAYIIRDPHIAKVRKMLTIEQFRNPEIKRLQTKRSYTDVMHYFEELVEAFILQRRLRDGDREVMAAQLCLPVSMWIALCDREPEREAEVMELIRRHISQFFEAYRGEGE